MPLASEPINPWKSPSRHRPRIVAATQVIRKMAGCCQAFLLDTDEGHYVAKVLENPVDYRVLVNELIASSLMRGLGISTPASAFVRISSGFLMENPLTLTAGSRSWQAGTGLHFGSRYAGEDVSVYDILPASLCGSVRNRDHFCGAAVFDSWVSNADFRQAVFVRTTDRNGFQAMMIDHSEAFAGPLWNFTDVAIPRLSRMRELYDTMTAGTLAPWIDRVAQLPEDLVWEAAETVPDEWLQGNRDELNRLLEKLLKRQQRIGEIVDLWFRNWGSRSKPVAVRP